MKKVFLCILSLVIAFLSIPVNECCVTVSAATTAEPVIFISNSFDDGVNLDIMNRGGVIEHSVVNQNGMSHFKAQKGTSASSYADMASPNIAGINTYILEADIIPVTIEGDAYIQLFDAKDIDTSWRLGCQFKSNGKIYAYNNGTSQYKEVGSWTKNTKVRLSLAYNVAQGTVTVYLNGNEVKSGFNTSLNIKCRKIRPYIFRIDLNNKSGADNVEFYIDNLRAYSGTKVLSDAEFNAIDSSVMDYDAVVNEFLTSSTEVYTTNGLYYYKNGVKQKYTGAGIDTKVVDDELYVSETFVSDFLGKQATQDIKVNIDGSSYISLENAANLYNKEYYYDDRGFFILSNDVTYFNDSANFNNMYDTVDYIFRYIFFDNPSGDEVLEDFNSTIQTGQHPRIWYNDTDISFINSQNNAQWNDVRYRATMSGDNQINYVNQNKPLTSNCATSNKKDQAYTFQLLMEYFANAYIVSNNSKYADKAIECMKTVCQWETLGGQYSSELTIGHWAMGMAIGYDVFYDYMNKTESGREDLAYFKERVVSLAFDPAIGLYKGLGSYETSGVGGECWINIRDNMMGVIGGGMLSLVLAFADEEDIQSKTGFLLENIIKSLELGTSMYSPDGGFFEGLQYADYMLHNLSRSIEALWKCCGTDYGLGSAEGFDKVGEYFVYMQSTQNSFNFHDCRPEFHESTIPFWLGYRYGKTDIAKLWYNQYEVNERRIYDVYTTLLCERSTGFSGSNTLQPLDKYFKDIETGSFRDSFANKNQTFVGFHGGFTGLSHDMLDLGQFVFEANGTQWAIDLGSDEYNLTDYFSTYNAYRKRTEGENCLVINPTNNFESDGTTKYDGQKKNVKSEVIMFETAPRAAMAALDLTQAYQRDVTSYKRGYYFGDSRNTLLIQDELTLKDTSEVYWFMHTKADITIIDQKTVRLTQDGKSVTVQLYCSESNVELKKMKAEPFSTSPTVTGQNANTGVNKLTVYIPEASGDVQIGVKLLPESVFYIPTDVSDTKISQWSLPKGEIEKVIPINNIVVNKANFLSAEIPVINDSEKIELYIDGEYVCDITDEQAQSGIIGAVDVSHLISGTHKAEIVITTSQGETIKGSSLFECGKGEIIFAFDHALKGYTGNTIGTGDGWHITGSGTCDTTQKNNYTLKSTAKNQSIWFGARTTDTTKYISNEAFVFECDIQLSSTLGKFVFECKSASSFFMHDIPLFSNGKMYNGDSYSAGTKYRVKIVLDQTTQECICFVDDKLLGYFPNMSALTELSTCKAQYVSSDANESISFSNVNIYKYGTKELSVEASVEKVGSELVVNASSDEMLDSAKLLVAEYKAGRLINVAVHNLINTSEYSDEISVNDDTEYLLTMVWDDFERCTSLSNLNYYRIK